jgi:hypothetical protein
MTISRRAAVVGAGALAITTALPVRTQALTAEERCVLDAVAEATPEQRAWTLETFRAASPNLRAAFLFVATMTPAQAEALLAREQESARMA